MLWIILLIVLGLILFFAELVLLPGITVAAVGAFVCLVAATTWAFVDFGVGFGFVVLGVVVACIAIMLSLFLRPKTWKKVALHTNLDQAFDVSVETKVAIGATGLAITRLAPVGKVLINGDTFEAKSPTDYIDQQTQIVVIGYENFSLIVNPLNK